MPEGRCDFVLLGWTFFIGFNLASDFLWGAGQQQAEKSAAILSTSELYRGEYRLEANGSSTQGQLHVGLGAEQTAIKAVSVAGMLMVLRPEDDISSFSLEPDMMFSALELPNVGRLAATGWTDPNRFRLFGRRPCRLSAALELTHGEKAPGSEEESPIVALAGEVAALDCGFSLHFSAEIMDTMGLMQKVIHYSIFANLLSAFQMHCFISQMRHTQDSPSASKVSMVCIGWIALTDAFDCFLHLSLGVASQFMFNTIAMVALFKFVLFSLLEARYLLIIQRQRQQEELGQGWEAVRAELYWLYSRLYGLLLCGLVLIYANLRRLHLLIFAFQFCWLPQIVLDAWQGSRSAMKPSFTLGVTATRTLLVLYLWGCPSTIFNGDLFPKLPGSPGPRLCMAIVGVQACQVLMMLSQRRWGSRWFVPWVCMPWAYNYHRASRVDPGTDCVICMGEIGNEDTHRVTTPCNHLFHQACLEQWMEVKMECPTCRASLPPIL